MSRPVRSPCASGQPPRAGAAAIRPRVARRTIPTRAQRGIAALAAVLLLCFALLLSGAFVGRNLLLEQRSAGHEVRAAQAFEAAEAGLEWALAQLDHPQRLGLDCLESTAADAASFRERHLRIEVSDGRVVPKTWNDGSTARALRPACGRRGDAWNCACPAGGMTTLPAAGADADGPAFAVEFSAHERPGVVHVLSTGCTRSVPQGCAADGATAAGEATARVQADFALLPALRTRPAATLTARGTVDAQGALLAVSNVDPETGIALHAGGAIAGANAVRLAGPAGAALAGTRIEHDASLAALSAARFFAAHFGIGKTAWKSQPAAQRIDCETDCAQTLALAAAATDLPLLAWTPGDLTLDASSAGTPLTLGSPERPIVLVADGALRLRGELRIRGVLYATSAHWEDTPPAGAQLRGALLAESDYRGGGTPALQYDPQAMSVLQRAAGSFVRVPGSWRDF